MQQGNKPFVAIWMVTYNHEMYIQDAIESVMMQKTDFDYKLFIGEDCSIDKTKDICISLKEKHQTKIELFINKKNLGGVKNATQIYNACFASGSKYMALLEGDDYWTDPNKLQKQVDFMEKNTDYNICFHKVKLFNQKEQSFSSDSITREVPDTTNIEELAKGNYMHTPSVMLRNNFSLPHWFSKVPIGDWSLYMIAIKDKKVKKLEDSMAVYRVNEEGVWSGKKRIDRMLMTKNTFKLAYKNLEIEPKAKNILSKTITNLEKVIRKNRTGIYGLKYKFEYFVARVFRYSLSKLKRVFQVA